MSLQDVESRFNSNLGRVESLVALYEDAKRAGGRRRGRGTVDSSDILRAAVTFLHATLEDFLRSLATLYWPAVGSKETINKVPLAGNRRPEKFGLGELLQFKGSSVDDVIVKSVTEHLNQYGSYSNTTEICTLLESLDVPQSRVERYLPALGALASRRHLIVHQADRNPLAGRGHHAAKSISKELVNRWIVAVRGFGLEVMQELR